MKIDGKKLLNLGEKHQKLFESTNINPYAYIIDNAAYFHVIYENKWTSKIKGYALISPDFVNKDNAIKALTPLVYYSVSEHNITNKGAFREKMDITFLEKVREYLRDVIEQESPNMNQELYNRAYLTIDSIIRLQDKLMKTLEEAKELIEEVYEKGFFTYEEMDQLVKYIPKFNLIQYKQLKPRYDNRKDFDVIYQNRNNVNLSNSIADSKLLKEMTSGIAEPDLERSLNELTKNIVIEEHHSYEQIYNKWLNRYYKDLML